MKILQYAVLTIMLSVVFSPVAHAESDHDVTTRFDVPYIHDGNPYHRLDMYISAPGHAPFTVLVHIHGGGWRGGNRNMRMIHDTSNRQILRLKMSTIQCGVVNF